MNERLPIFRALGDPLRLRAFVLLSQTELSVGELSSILGAGQSTTSTVLKTLKEADLVRVRPDGRRAWYSVGGVPDWVGLAAGELGDGDRLGLERVLAARRAPDAPWRGTLGRSWEGLARLLLATRRLGVVADVGVGTGELTTLLAGASVRLYAVDSCGDLLAGLENVPGIQCVLQDVHRLMLPEPVEHIFCSHTLRVLESPGDAVLRMVENLRPGGRVLISELALHGQELGDRHPGFGVDALEGFLREAGLAEVAVMPLSHDSRGFLSLLATGVRP